MEHPPESRFLLCTEDVRISAITLGSGEVSKMTPESELCQSMLAFVIDGVYPDAEAVVASDFPASAIPKELQLLSKAKDQLEVTMAVFLGRFIRPLSLTKAI